VSIDLLLFVSRLKVTLIPVYMKNDMEWVSGAQLAALLAFKKNF
jgi:hypothetical protein